MPEERKIRLLIVDDHPVVRDGLRAIVGQQADMEVVATARDGRSAVAEFQNHHPDVTLMDLQLPDMTGIDAISEIRNADPRTRFVVLSTFMVDEDVFQAVRAGAKAYLLKDCSREELLQAIRDVFDGKQHFPQYIATKIADHLSRPSLSPREIEVLGLISEGKANKEIATLLNISQGTVKAHVRNLFTKLKATSRTEAVNVGVKFGIIRLD